MLGMREKRRKKQIKGEKVSMQNRLILPQGIVRYRKHAPVTVHGKLSCFLRLATVTFDM